MKLLIHSRNEFGGLAEHTHYQARAFVAAGVNVTVLCTQGFTERRTASYPVDCVYVAPPARPAGEGKVCKALRLVRMSWRLLCNQWRLAVEVCRRKPDAVLFDSYIEYLAPLWVWPHIMLSRFYGVIYVANLHDPIRDFQLGPAWWHRMSVAMGYWPLHAVVVHQHLPEPDVVPKRVRVVEAPVGVYQLEDKAADRQEVRQQWEVGESAIVFLAFGFIRDNKNIDLLIQAIVDNPRAVLVVMGSSQSSAQKPLGFYEQLAARCGVADRVRFRLEFVPDVDLPGYFAAADFIAITYNRHFHSQSGVLNLAANARKAVLASAGDSPLKGCVERFRLGEFVEPDSLAAIKAGMARLCALSDKYGEYEEPDWSGYAAFASWEKNAAIILDAIESFRKIS